MVGDLGVWNPREAHQPRSQDDLLGPLPFGQSENDCQSDDEGSRSLDLGEDARRLAVSSFRTLELKDLKCRGVKDPKLAKSKIMKRS
jgi:hypothetical protein